ncbi:MAG TPA: hypothetical protein VN310_15670 [Candidatus Dormibacteraeota bacterium]|jgi:hypothetical protein|nr:hypothetical protein [Candidatus Dormibacteraeota bacterium]
MLRNFVLSLSLLCLLAICSMTINCGSSSSSNGGGQNCTGGPFNVVGDWQITVSDSGGGGTTNGFGAINSAGLALFFDTSGDSLALPTITGTSCFSGSTTAYGPPGLGGGAIADASQGTVNSATSISGSFTGTGGNPSGTISATSYSPESSVTALSGAMLGEIASEAVILDLTFTPGPSNSSMTFTGSNGFSCDVSGSFSQEAAGNVASINVFDVSMTFSGTGCPTATTAAIAGLGFESSSDYFGFNLGAAATYLYADMLDPAGPFAIEIFPQGVAGAAAAAQASKPAPQQRWPLGTYE